MVGEGRFLALLCSGEKTTVRKICLYWCGLFLPHHFSPYYLSLSSAFCKSFNWWGEEVRFWLNTDETGQGYLFSLCSYMSWHWYRSTNSVFASFSENPVHCTLGYFICVFLKRVARIKKWRIWVQWSFSVSFFVMNFQHFHVVFEVLSFVEPSYYSKCGKLHVIKMRRTWKYA